MSCHDAAYRNTPALTICQTGGYNHPKGVKISYWLMTGILTQTYIDFLYEASRVWGCNMLSWALAPGEMGMPWLAQFSVIYIVHKHVIF